MRLIRWVGFVLFVATLCGCTDAERAKLAGFGNPHKVELYSGGKRIRAWIASGKVESEANSDGYYFEDLDSGRLIEVSGEVVITRLKDQEEAKQMLGVLKSGNELKR